MNATEKQEAQTAEQTTYIFNWWFEHSAPTGLLNSEHNGVTLAQHIAKNFKGYITPLILTQACQELGDIETGGKLQYHHVVEKIVEVERKKTAQEIEHEKQIIRNREGITKSPLVR